MFIVLRISIVVTVGQGAVHLTDAYITEPDSVVSAFKSSSATLYKYTESVPSPET